jgi:AcrR family transcriptional regulator
VSTVNFGSFPDKTALYEEAAEAAFLELGRRFRAAAIADVPGLCRPEASERLARVIWAAGHGLVVLTRSKAEALPDPMKSYVETLFQMIMAQASTANGA